MTREQILKKEIIAAGRRCAGLRLVTARAGNISSRLDKENILITASGAALGSLKPSDIVKVRLAAGPRRPFHSGRPFDKRPSSEFPLHRLIHLNFPGDRCVVHCHPSLTNAYFYVNKQLTNLTFESKFYLGDVPVVRQKTLTVTDPGPVIEALRASSIVVIKNHGVFSRAKDFLSALERIEILEEAVRIHALALLFKRKKLGPLAAELKRDLCR